MSEKKCDMCQPGMPTLGDAEIKEALQEYDGWEYDAGKNVIFRVYKFKGFYKTMAFVNAVAWIANQQGHHPDMQVSYNSATICYQTHEAGGITKNDLICAGLINDLG